MDRAVRLAAWVGVTGVAGAAALGACFQSNGNKGSSGDGGPAVSASSSGGAGDGGGTSGGGSSGGNGSGSSSGASGTWTGTSSQTGVTPTAVQIVLVEDGGVSGTVGVSDDAGSYLVVEVLSGTRTGNVLHLTGAAGLLVDATLSGNTLTGTAAFPLDDGDAVPYVSSLQATRP
jgi:hypothetical protein